MGSSPLGISVLVWQGEHLCFLGFPENEAHAWREIRSQRHMPQPHRRCDEHARRWLARIFPPFERSPHPLPIQAHGSDFQCQVWRGLLRLQAQTQEGWSYARLARYLGRPSACRAVAQALARNPLAWLIPCHRIIPTHGGMGGYRWGPLCKRKLWSMESSGWTPIATNASFVTPGHRVRR